MGRQGDAASSEADVINSILRVSISGGPFDGRIAATTPTTFYDPLDDVYESVEDPERPGKQPERRENAPKETDIVQERPEMADDGESGSDDEPDAKKKGVNQGRRKIDIEFIGDKNKRHITFSKRKAGIMKKAYELSTLTDTQVLLLVVSETGLVYTYTTPRLQPLVSGKRGKNLIQQCLVAPGDDQPPQSADGTPLVDYPEPKVRQYAPNGRRVSQQRSPTKKRPPPLELDSKDSIPPVPAIPQEHAQPFSTPRRPSTDVAPSFYQTPVTGPQDLFSGLPMPVFDYSNSVPTSPYGLKEGCNPSLYDQVSAPNFHYAAEAVGEGSASSVVSAATGNRTLKKRKTVENLKSKKSSSNIKESAAKILDASEKAAKALNQARANPCIETLMKAFNLQQEAQEQAESKPKGSMSPNIDAHKAMHPISVTLSELQMALSQLSTAQFSLYRQNPNYFNPADAIQLSSPVESFVPLFGYFFETHVVNTKADTDTIAQYAIDLSSFAAWLLGHAFIGNSIHSALTKHCSGRKSATPKLASTLAQFPNGHPQPSGSNAKFDFGGQPTYSIDQTLYPTPEAPPMTQQASTRVARAERVLAEYCLFARNRYKAHWEQTMPVLRGTFIVLAVAASFLLLDDVTVAADRQFLDSEAPFKVRTTPYLNSVIRRGDRINCSLQKATGSSFWLPVTGGSIIGNHLPDANTEYTPTPELHAYEMEQCQRREDHVGFAIAFAAHNKAKRAETLLEMGEFSDEGFRTSSPV